LEREDQDSEREHKQSDEESNEGSDHDEGFDESDKDLVEEEVSNEKNWWDSDSGSD